MRALPCLLALLTLLGGCPAITDAQLEQRRDLDDDKHPSDLLGGDDCDDHDGAVHPGAVEVCDGVDNDCDGLTNEADPDMPADVVEWFLDADDDGYGSDLVHERSCRVLAGYVHRGGDCDDTDADQHPGQRWYLDGDGDGWGIEGTYRDQCLRPAAYVLPDPHGQWDCDDANALRNPGQNEVCDGVDNDCDNLADDDDAGDVDAETWYPDVDADTWGDALSPGRATCSPREGEVRNALDCDDGNAQIYPGAPDAPYDGPDSNCDGVEYDRDGDGHTASDPVANPDAVGSHDDCDDARSWVYPGAPELCNGVSDGCDLAWTAADEDRQAAFTPGFSPDPFSLPPPPTDWTGVLSNGGVVTIGEGGELRICGTSPSGGSWTGDVVITGGTVAIRAPSGSAVTVLDAGATGTSGVAVALGGGGAGQAPSLTIDGLAITGGSGHSSGFGQTQGGCVYAVGVEDVTLTDVDLSGCTAQEGGGAYLDAAGTVALSGALVAGDVASAYDGGGAWVRAARLTVGDTTFDANQAANTGGALFVVVTGATYDVERSTFSGNSSVNQWGGAIHLAAPGPQALTAIHRDTTFTANTATISDGGAVYVEQVDLTRFLSCTLTDNRASYGGAIYARSPVDLVDTALDDNVGSLDGGAVYVSGGDVECTSPTGQGELHGNNRRAVTIASSGSPPPQFNSTACDFGIGATANTPIDVYTNGAGHDYSGIATFDCDTSGCTP